MFREIPDALLREVYASESFTRSAQGKQALDRCGAEICVVSDEVFQAISDTRTPQGILALAGQLHYRPEGSEQKMIEGGSHIMMYEKNCYHGFQDSIAAFLKR